MARNWKHYYSVRVPTPLVMRFKPITAQRHKDHQGVYLHTMNKELPVGQENIMLEGIEFYADLHLPISTTPIERVAREDNKVSMMYTGWSQYLFTPQTREDYLTYMTKLIDSGKIQPLADNELLRPGHGKIKGRVAFAVVRFPKPASGEGAPNEAEVDSVWKTRPEAAKRCEEIKEDWFVNLTVFLERGRKPGPDDGTGLSDLTA